MKIDQKWPYGLIVLCIISMFLISCLKDDIEDLQNQIDDLKSHKYDTVFFGDLMITNQEQLELFKSQNIKHITGELILENIVDLSPFEDLASVGSIYIHTNVKIIGFNKLTDLKVYNYFNMWFSSNDDLIIDGFEKIESLEGFTINNSGGGSLTINGLNNLTSCNYLSFYTNGNLTINGLESFESSYFLSLAGFNVTINAFSQLTTFEGSIHINASVLLINGFDQLREISGSLNIWTFNENPIIWESGNEFKNLRRVGGTLSTPDFKNFSNLIHIQTLEIGRNYFGEDLSQVDLPALVELFALGVHWNNSIKTFDGLNVPTFYSLSIYSCDSLNSISNLSDFIRTYENPPNNEYDYYSSDIIISYNSKLTSLDGLEKVSKVGYLEIFSNSQLVDFCGIKQLIDNVENYKYIEENAINPQNSTDITGCE